MRGLRALATASIALLGCAPSSLTLELTRTDAIYVPMQGGAGQEIVVVDAFSDETTVGDRCGFLVGSFARVAGDIHCGGDAAAWLAELLREQLRRSGFSVVSDAQASPDAPRIDGALLKLFVEVRDTFGTLVPRIEGDIHVRLTATSPSGLSAKRDFYVKRQSVFADRRVTSTYRAALHRVTQQFLTETTAALIELTERYPSRPR